MNREWYDPIIDALLDFLYYPFEFFFLLIIRGYTGRGDNDGNS